MSPIAELVNLDTEDEELIPEILSVEARLAFKGAVSAILPFFERVASIVPVKEVIPGTGFAKIETVSGSNSSLGYARLTATDGEKSLQVVLDEIEILRFGVALIPAKKIVDILRLANAISVKIEIMGNTARIYSGRAVWTIQVPPGENLAPLVDVSDLETQPVNRVTFLSALMGARKAVAQNSSRPALQQAMIENGSITACDGARLHRIAVDGLSKTLDLSVPSFIVDELIRALKASEDELFYLGADAYHLVFKIGASTLIAQRLLVDFPNMESLILGPAFENTETLTVERNELLGIIKRVKINSDPEFASIFLNLLPGKTDSEGNSQWFMAVKAKDRDGNTSQELIEVQRSGGKLRELCLNHVYLTDLLTSYSESSVTFRLGEDSKTKLSPLLVDDKELGFTAVVTQMRKEFLV